jgi:hypothetical protein
MSIEKGANGKRRGGREERGKKERKGRGRKLTVWAHSGIVQEIWGEQLESMSNKLSANEEWMRGGMKMSIEYAYLAISK